MLSWVRTGAYPRGVVGRNPSRECLQGPENSSGLVQRLRCYGWSLKRFYFILVWIIVFWVFGIVDLLVCCFFFFPSSYFDLSSSKNCFICISFCHVFASFTVKKGPWDFIIISSLWSWQWNSGHIKYPKGSIEVLVFIFLFFLFSSLCHFTSCVSSC